jgi:hypothetical protein
MPAKRNQFQIGEKLLTLYNVEKPAVKSKYIKPVCFFVALLLWDKKSG